MTPNTSGNLETGKVKGPGRDKALKAEAHERILDTVQAILVESKSLNKLTIEQIAQKAGVGKPTIYKWWSSKTSLVMALFKERMIPSINVDEHLSFEEKIRQQTRNLVELLQGFFGEVACQIIAEGQSDEKVLEQYQEHYMSTARAVSLGWIEQAIQSGDIRSDLDPELVVDMIYGPIYYRLLTKYKTLDATFGDAIVDQVMNAIFVPRSGSLGHGV